MENISKHISYAEAIYSATAKRRGITNSPDQVHIDNMMLFAERIFECVREHFAGPIIINSMFRSLTLNNAIGGSSTSQHMSGEAADIRAPWGASYTNADIFNYIKENLDFDQLIWEYGNDDQPDWVHVSYHSSSSPMQRSQVLRVKRIEGKPSYSQY